MSPYSTQHISKQDAMRRIEKRLPLAKNEQLDRILVLIDEWIDGKADPTRAWKIATIEEMFARTGSDSLENLPDTGHYNALLGILGDAMDILFSEEKIENYLVHPTQEDATLADGR